MPLRYKKFDVYPEIKAFVVQVFSVLAKLPKEHLFGICDQGRRASLSVLLNFSEGAEKGSDKEFNRYLNNALGSLNETAAVLDIAKELNLVDKKEYDDILGRVVIIGNRLGALSKKLKISAGSRQPVAGSKKGG